MYLDRRILKNDRKPGLLNTKQPELWVKKLCIYHRHDEIKCNLIPVCPNYILKNHQLFMLMYPLPMAPSFLLSRKLNLSFEILNGSKYEYQGL